MNIKKKILFFHFDLGEGGAERVLVNLLNNLDSEKYEITLRTIFTGQINNKQLKQHIKFKPLFNRPAFRGMRLLFKAIPAKVLNKILIKESFDYQIAFLEGIPTRIVGAVTSKNGEKKFAWVHVSADQPNAFTTSFRSKKEFSRIYKNFTKIAFVSNQALVDFEKFYDISVTKGIVHNVNDFGKIRTLSNESIDISLSKNTINICSVGRLTKQKRFDRLINALYRLDQKGFENWHLYLLGKGELESDLIALRDKLRLSHKITFMGFQDNPYKFISKMDLFVCSSEREGFSTAVTEAVFLGLPVVTTLCAGMEEIIENTRTGFIVENSQEGLYSGLELFFNLNAKDRILIKQNAIMKGTMFNIDKSIKEFEEFIES